MIPPLTAEGGVTGWWFVDHEAARRMTMRVWDDEARFQVGMAQIQAAREKDPDRHRPAPTSVSRFEIYGSTTA